MSSIKVGEAHGFTITYSPDRMKFLVINSDDEELAEADTQEKAVVTAERIKKQTKKGNFPVSVLHLLDGVIVEAKVTSVTDDGRYAWISTSTGKSKMSFVSHRILPDTPKNRVIMEKVQANNAVIKEKQKTNAKFIESVKAFALKAEDF